MKRILLSLSVALVTLMGSAQVLAANNSYEFRIGATMKSSYNFAVSIKNSNGVTVNQSNPFVSNAGSYEAVAALNDDVSGTASFDIVIKPDMSADPSDKSMIVHVYYNASTHGWVPDPTQQSLAYTLHVTEKNHWLITPKASR